MDGLIDGAEDEREHERHKKSGKIRFEYEKGENAGDDNEKEEKGKFDFSRALHGERIILIIKIAVVAISPPHRFSFISANLSLYVPTFHISP